MKSFGFDAAVVFCLRFARVDVLSEMPSVLLSVLVMRRATLTRSERHGERAVYARLHLAEQILQC
jgi:hypothetical protein